VPGPVPSPKKAKSDPRTGVKSSRETATTFLATKDKGTPAWHVETIGNKLVGPFSVEELAGLYKDGTISKETRVRTPGGRLLLLKYADLLGSQRWREAQALGLRVDRERWLEAQGQEQTESVAEKATTINTEESISPGKQKGVRSWHPGQLVVFWIGVLILGFIILVVGGGASSEYAAGIYALILLGLLLFALRLTWKWFGARND
jgi:hypothetical protein